MEPTVIGSSHHQLSFGLPARTASSDSGHSTFQIAVAQRSSRAGHDDRTPWPGLRECTAYLRLGQGGLPLGLGSSEGVGLARGADLSGNFMPGVDEGT